MKQFNKYQVGHVLRNGPLFLAILLLLAATGCMKEPHSNQIIQSKYVVVNLVADVAGYGAARLDPVLVNAWGIAVAPSGPVWIAANHTGLSTIYDRTGATLRQPVVLPSFGKPNGGSQTGIVFNNTTDFKIPSTGAVSKFIFAAEDGTISAWSGGSTAVVVADRSGAHAVYKGLAMGREANHNYIYAANFKERKIDVFDENFKLVTTMPFKDPSMPAGYGPFNIRNIGGKLFVTYAKQGPGNEDDESGPGNGFVDIYSVSGRFVKRFASHGTLNSPWGIAAVSRSFFGLTNTILIGNFGDGRINIFAPDGTYIGQLMNDKNTPLSIEGLWALEPNVPLANANQLFFTAGPAHEEHGLFGYIKRK